MNDRRNSDESIVPSTSSNNAGADDYHIRKRFLDLDRLLSLGTPDMGVYLSTAIRIPIAATAKPKIRVIICCCCKPML